MSSHSLVSPRPGGLATRPSRAALLALAISALLSGCANPLPQYLSEHDMTPSIVTSAISQERDGSCAGLEAARDKAVAERAAAEGKIKDELVRPAPTVSSALKRAFGPAGSGTSSYDAANRASARASALDAELTRRNCGAPAMQLATQQPGFRPAGGPGAADAGARVESGQDPARGADAGGRSGGVATDR